jgi:hypothetical protein
MPLASPYLRPLGKVNGDLFLSQVTALLETFGAYLFLIYSLSLLLLFSISHPTRPLNIVTQTIRPAEQQVMKRAMA